MRYFLDSRRNAYTAMTSSSSGLQWHSLYTKRKDPIAMLP